MKKVSLIIVVAILAVGTAVFLYRDYVAAYLARQVFKPRSLIKNSSLLGTEKNAAATDTVQETIQGSLVETVADDLVIPWEIIFLPDSSLLVTERSGSLVRINPNSKEKIPVNGVKHTGEGGLLGMALHPNFATNHWLYLYLTTETSEGLINRVERYDFDSQKNALSNRQVIIEKIPGARVHDGGRLAFGPDKLLYITTGDANNQKSPQDTTALSGKILRVKDDGSIPADNPFANAVYSYGHRNPQGIVWNSDGALWETEHGPSGLETGDDEVNVIEKGKNYGWPLERGSESKPGMVTPIINSGRTDTWAPAAAEIVNNVLFFTGLRGETLYSAKIQGRQLGKLTEHFTGEFGRLRIVKLDPNKTWLYLGTSNTDGRGEKKAGDDKIVRVNVKQLMSQL